MSIIQNMLLHNRNHNIIPHHIDALTIEQTDVCLSVGCLAYPVIRLSDGEFQYNYIHSDTRYQPDSYFKPFIEEKASGLSFNEEYHIRCSSISIEDNHIEMRTQWSDFSQFLGTNMMVGTYIPIREKVKDHVPISPLLANELAAIGTFIIHDGQEKYLLLTKRGANVSTYRNCMSASVSGAMGGGEKWTDFHMETRKPDPILTIIRETKEELGLDINRSQLKLDGLCMQAIDKQPNFLVSGELPISKDEVLKKAKAAADKDEIEEDGLLFIPFELDKIMPYLIYLEYSSTSAAGVWALLENYFTQDEIKTAFQQCCKG